MKNFIINILRFFFSNPDFFLKIKDVIFTEPAEHLFRSIRFIRSKKIDLENKIIIDIGAADGNTSIYFSKAFPDCNVLAFEPIPESFEIAEKNIKNFPQIKLHKLALSNSNKTAQFHVSNNYLSSSLLDIKVSENGFSNSDEEKKISLKKTFNVQVTTLDSFKIKSEVLIMKIDTQGTELDVLKGSIETLKNTCFVLVEMNNNDFYNNGCQYYEVDEFLRSQNFFLVDNYIIYRPKGRVYEYDALYERKTQ